MRTKPKVDPRAPREMLKWPRFSHLIKRSGLNLGAGRNTHDDLVNVDMLSGPGINQVVDLFELPWPWESDAFDYVYCSHFLEHVPRHIKSHYEFLYPFINEMLRVIESGGYLEIFGPHPQGIHALESIGHYRLVGLVTFYPWLNPDVIYSNEVAELVSNKHLELIHVINYRCLQIGLISDYHFRKYLGLNVGHLAGVRILFRVSEGGQGDER